MTCQANRADGLCQYCKGLPPPPCPANLMSRYTPTCGTKSWTSFSQLFQWYLCHFSTIFFLIGPFFLTGCPPCRIEVGPQNARLWDTPLPRQNLHVQLFLPWPSFFIHLSLNLWESLHHFKSFEFLHKTSPLHRLYCIIHLFSSPHALTKPLKSSKLVWFSNRSKRHSEWQVSVRFLTVPGHSTDLGGGNGGS